MERKKGVVDKCRPISLSVTGRTRLIFALAPGIGRYHERMHAMRLYPINPSNPLVSIAKVKENRWNRYRVWGNLCWRHQPMISLGGNLSYRSNVRVNRKVYADLKSSVTATRQRKKPISKAWMFSNS
jgi:hypothetical protein